MEGLIFGQSRSLYLSKEKKNCKFIRLIKTVTDSLRKENNLVIRIHESHIFVLRKIHF